MELGEHWIEGIVLLSGAVTSLAQGLLLLSRTDTHLLGGSRAYSGREGTVCRLCSASSAWSETEEQADSGLRHHQGCDVGGQALGEQRRA